MAFSKMHRLRTPPPWAVWTLLCSLPAWARTPLTCVWHIVDGLEFMGVKIDPEKNNIRGEERIDLRRRLPRSRFWSSPPTRS